MNRIGTELKFFYIAKLDSWSIRCIILALIQVILRVAGLEKNLGFFRKLLGFLDLSVQISLDTKFPSRKNIHSLLEHFL